MTKIMARPAVTKITLLIIVPCLLTLFSISCGKTDTENTQNATAQNTAGNSDLSTESIDNTIAFEDLVGASSAQTSKSWMTLREYEQLAGDDRPSVEDDGPQGCDFTTFNKQALDLQRKALGSSNHVICAASLFQLTDILKQGASGTTSENLSEGIPFLDEASHPVSDKCVENTDIALTHLMWGQENYLFSKNFLQTIDTHFQPEFTVLDFLNDSEGAENTISSTFPDTLRPPSVSDRTRMVVGVDIAMAIDTGSLIQAAEKFDGLFEGFDGQQYRKSHIRIQGEYGFFQSDQYRAFQLSSETSPYSMLFIFPSSEEILTELSENLAFTVSTLLTSLKTETVSFAVPEFSIKSFYAPSFLLGFGETADDFSGVNDQGYLLVKEIAVTSAINLNFESIAVSGISTAVLDATPDEPESMWAGLVGMCIRRRMIIPMEYIKAGVADSTPFIFIIRDTETGAILVSGSLVDSGGEEAGEWVEGWRSLTTPVINP